MIQASGATSYTFQVLGGSTTTASTTTFSSLQNGNVIKGDGKVINGSNNLIYDNTKFTAIVGADNLVVVNTNDATLVVSKEKVEDVKLLVEYLKLNGKSDLI